jgi:hypothetical protein
MTDVRVHSQNLRGSMSHSLSTLTQFLNDDCECTTILLQDVGPTSSEGTPLLRRSLVDHTAFFNFSKTNKSKSVGIIVHRHWQVLDVRRDLSGCTIAVTITNTKVLISAYLPTGLASRKFGTAQTIPQILKPRWWRTQMIIFYLCTY